MIYYAIKHMPTGGYLPQLRRKRGHTHTEPLPLEGAVPRLHHTERGAKVALWYWLKGTWREDYNTGDWGTSEYCGNFPKKQLERKREDMQIVKMRVKEWMAIKEQAL